MPRQPRSRRSPAPASEPQPFHPVLRGVLLTGRGQRWLRHDVAGGGGEGDDARRALWWPPTKVAGRYLAPYLQTLDEAEFTDADRPPGELVELTVAGHGDDRPARRRAHRRGTRVGRMTSHSRSRGVQDNGWAVFAGVLFLLAGIFHLMWGIAAFASDDTFIADELLFGDLSLWACLPDRRCAPAGRRVARLDFTPVGPDHGPYPRRAERGQRDVHLCRVSALVGDHPHSRPARHLRPGRPRRRYA